MAFRNYRLSDLAIRQAGELGLTRSDSKQMARESAPFTDVRWNRRFEIYVFRIDGDLVTELGKISNALEVNQQSIVHWAVPCVICHGRLKMTFYEEHAKCGGKGCMRCDRGEVRVERRCSGEKSILCSEKLGLTNPHV